MRKLVNEAHRRCHENLTSYEDRLETVAAALLEHETLHAPEFQAIMRGEDPFQSVDDVEEPQPRGKHTSAPDGSELPREGDSRDQGLDLSGGTLPAPA